MSDLIKKMILQLFAYSRGEQGYKKEEAKQLIDWVEITTKDFKLIQTILQGYALPDIKDGHIIVVSKEYDQAKKMIEEAFPQDNN